MDDVYNTPQQLRDFRAMTRHPRLRLERADDPTAGRVMTEPARIEPEHFRRALAHLPTGVSVITADGAGGPTGKYDRQLGHISVAGSPACPALPGSELDDLARHPKCGRVLHQRDGRSPCRSHVPTSQQGEAFYEVSPRRQGRLRARRQGRLRAGAAGHDRHLLRSCDAGESKGHGPSGPLSSTPGDEHD